VALPKLISDFAALERRQRWCRKLSPRSRLFFFQRMYHANQDIGIVHTVGPAFDRRRFRAIADSWKNLNVLVAVNGCGWCSEATQRE
jgi:hypothetical protein